MKKWKKLNTLPTLLLLCTCFYAYAQPQNFNELTGRLTSFSTQNFQEKIFVHTDKSFYMCGEICWFKLYNVDALFNKPVTISKVAYVEILTVDHRPVLQSKIELNAGTGTGSFLLPFSLNSGVYVLRAYTSWMKNYSPDLFFEMQLTIINSLKKLPPREKDSATYSIRFYPEGGNLVTGLQSKVAFHAVGRDGRGISCKGIIINQHKDSITSFQTLRFGMGSFSFTPLKNDAYKAIITTVSGETATSVLPSALKEGYVMKLSHPDTGHVKISVFSADDNHKNIFMLVHTRQVVKKSEAKTLAKGFAEFVIPKKQLGGGISHFTVFNENRQPVCERLYFQSPGEKLHIGITTGRQEYSLREKVSVELNLNDLTPGPATADLSLSVFPVDSLQLLPESNIHSYLWLGSELRGMVESPSYYFNSTNKQVGEAADNLMLTQGWSRFKWDEVLSIEKPSYRFLPEYEGPVITGTIHEKYSGAPAKNLETYISVPGQKFVFKTCTSDDDGKVTYNLDKFYGNNEVVIQAPGILKEQFNIDISNPFSDNFSSRNYPSLQVSEKWKDQLLYHSVGTQVENTYVQDKKQQFSFQGAKDTANFYGDPGKTYWLDDYTRFITMEEVMREYVTEVRVRKQQEKFTYQVRNSIDKLFFENNPLVLLDGVPVFDITKIIEYNPLKIKRLDLVTRKFISGNKTFDGIVSYQTYKGDLDGFQLDANTTVLEYPGLQLRREFYSPQYPTREQVESRTPDFRNLLYWDPAIKSNAKGISEISFYTSDRPGKYAVIVHGINSNGIAGTETVFFTVKK